MTHPLDGVIVPLVTVLDDTGRPDAADARGFLDTLAAEGVRTLMLLGSNGEGALLPPDTTQGYLRDVVAHWHASHADAAVAVNVSAPGTTDMLRRAEAALGAEPDILITSPPGYFRHRADEVEAHIRAIGTFDHPFAIYNVPSYANALPPEVFEALLDESRLVGLKDSSGDLDALAGFLAVAAARPDVVVTQGDERRLLDGLRVGARGIVPGLANLSPRLSVELYRAWAAGDDSTAEEAQARLTALAEIHRIRPGVPTVKGVLRDRGVLASDRCAPPLASLSGTELDELRRFLAPFEADLVGPR